MSISSDIALNDLKTMMELIIMHRCHHLGKCTYVLSLNSRFQLETLSTGGGILREEMGESRSVSRGPTGNLDGPFEDGVSET